MEDLENLEELVFEGTGEGTKEDPLSVYVYLEDIPEDVEFSELENIVYEIYGIYENGEYVECENTVHRGKLERRYIWHFYD